MTEKVFLQHGEGKAARSFEFFYQRSKLTEAYGHPTGIASKWRIQEHSGASRECFFKTMSFSFPRFGRRHLLPPHAS